MTSFRKEPQNHRRDTMIECSCFVNGQCMCYNMQACNCDLDCSCQDCEDMQLYLVVNENQIKAQESGCPCGGNCQCGQWD